MTRERQALLPANTAKLSFGSEHQKQHVEPRPERGAGHVLF
jgi:hypothetical protein